MKVLYYDAFCGISGDMNLGAMVDLGVPFQHLEDELAKMNIADEYKLIQTKVIKKGIAATKVDVILLNQEEHTCDQHEKHGYYEEQVHGHDHNGECLHEYHSHRTFKSIRQMIENSTLNENIKALSIDMFNSVAEAEAKVHGREIDDVHFHEVGATDSIVDIVGAAICIDFLNVDRIMASPITVGSGYVKCAHGIMPVPAPATAEILADIPCRAGIVESETTTPTGAAIIKTNASVFTKDKSFSVEKIGYGAGDKDFEVPNILRVYLGELEDEKRFDLNVEKQMMLELNIDDMNPEYLPSVEKLIFENGALDVYRTPIIMKKSRMATKLSVLFPSDKKHRIIETVLRNTTTAGFRMYEVDKYMMKRSFRTVATSMGEVNVKDLRLNGEVLRSKIEYEDLNRLAAENGISILEVERQLSKEV